MHRSDRCNDTSHMLHNSCCCHQLLVDKRSRNRERCLLMLMKFIKVFVSAKSQVITSWLNHLWHHSSNCVRHIHYNFESHLCHFWNNYINLWRIFLLMPLFIICSLSEWKKKFWQCPISTRLNWCQIPPIHSFIHSSNLAFELENILYTKR